MDSVYALAFMDVGKPAVDTDLLLHKDRTRMHDTYPEAVKEMIEAGAFPGDPLSMPLNEARIRQERYLAWLGQDQPTIVSREDVEIDGPVGTMRLRIIRPSVGQPLPVVLFIRGSGWWAGSLDSHERTVRLFANASGLAVCALDYHRTPEHRYPVQRNEVLATIDWLRSGGHGFGLDPTRLILWGESAGATLALSAAQTLQERAHYLCGLILFYGNFDVPGPLARPYSHWVYDQYLGDAELRSDPQAVPLLGNMYGLPRTWLGVGELDPLVDATIALSEKLAAAQVPYTLVRFPGLPHAFAGLTRILAPAGHALRIAAEAARSMTFTSMTENHK